MTGTRGLDKLALISVGLVATSRLLDRLPVYQAIDPLTLALVHFLRQTDF